MPSSSPQANLVSKWILPLVLILCTAFLGTLVYYHSDQHIPQYTSKSMEATKDMRLLTERSESPNFVWTTEDGTKFSLDKLAGKVVYINFWAIWCPPCREEIPLLTSLAEEFKDKDLQMVFVNMDQEKDNLNKAYELSSKLIPARLSTYKNQSFRSHLNVQMLPYHVLIDKQGRVAGEFYGDLLELKSEITQLFEQLLQEQN